MSKKRRGPRPGGHQQAKASQAPAPAAVPSPPRDPASAVLTDHEARLRSLAEAPLEEQAQMLRAVHQDLAKTLSEAEG